MEIPFLDDDDTPEHWKGLSAPSLVQIVLLPFSLVLGFVLSKVGFLSMLLWYFVTVPLHEFGHAIGAWLGSRFALPIGAFIPMAGFTMMGQARSVLVGAVISVGLVALAAWGRQRRSGGLVLFAVLVFGLWVHWTFFVSPIEWQRFSIWAGAGGEFFLSTFLILLGFYDLPVRAHWEFFRMPAIFYGGLGFSASFGKWIAIKAGQASMPMGSFLSGSSDANGDMERLIQAHGWTTGQIIRSYHQIGSICAVLIAVHWIYFLSRRFRASQR